MIKLKQLRIEAGITVTDLAKKAGIAEQTVKKVENRNLGKPETKAKCLKAYNELTSNHLSSVDAFMEVENDNV